MLVSLPQPGLLAPRGPSGGVEIEGPGSRHPGTPGGRPNEGGGQYLTLPHPGAPRPARCRWAVASRGSVASPARPLPWAGPRCRGARPGAGASAPGTLGPRRGTWWETIAMSAGGEPGERPSRPFHAGSRLPAAIGGGLSDRIGRAGIIADSAINLLHQRGSRAPPASATRSSAPSASRRNGPDTVATRQIEARIRIKVRSSFIRHCAHAKLRDQAWHLESLEAFTTDSSLFLAMAFITYNVSSCTTRCEDHSP